MRSKSAICGVFCLCLLSGVVDSSHFIIWFENLTLQWCRHCNSARWQFSTLLNTYGYCIGREIYDNDAYSLNSEQKNRMYYEKCEVFKKKGRKKNVNELHIFTKCYFRSCIFLLLYSRFSVQCNLTVPRECSAFQWFHIYILERWFIHEISLVSKGRSHFFFNFLFLPYTYTFTFSLYINIPVSKLETYYLFIHHKISILLIMDLHSKCLWISYKCILILLLDVKYFQNFSIQISIDIDRNIRSSTTTTKRKKKKHRY